MLGQTIAQGTNTVRGVERTDAATAAGLARVEGSTTRGPFTKLRRPPPGYGMLASVSARSHPPIRIGVWNLDSSQPLKSRVAQRAWLVEAADVWLLTEVHDAAVDGLDCGCSAPVAGIPRLSWAGVLSARPVVDRPVPRHPTLALARIALAEDFVALFASSVLPWRGAGRYWPAEDPGPYRERFHGVLAEHQRIISSEAGGGMPVVWGGDFNQELDGPYRAGTAEGRDAVLEAFDRLGLVALSRPTGAGEEGARAIDHIAVPRSWECGSLTEALPNREGRPLSDHFSYQVSVSRLPTS